jgi:hypothetical protein
MQERKKKEIKYKQKVQIMQKEHKKMEKQREKEEKQRTK